MKKVTTNMTFGQILFILFILLASSLMFFYFGAKFGGDILTLADLQAVEAEEPFFPDDKLSAEIQNIIASHDQKLVFHDAVIENGPLPLNPVPGKRDEPAAKVSIEKPTSTALVAPTVVPTVAVKKDTAKADVATKSAVTTVPVPQNQTALPSVSDALRTAVANRPVPVQKDSKTAVKTKSPDAAAKKVLLPGAVPETEQKIASIPPPVVKPLQTAVKPVVPPENKLKVLLPGQSPGASAPKVATNIPAAQLVPTADQGNPNSANAAPPGKTYRLQVGSYSEKKSATDAKSQWESRGYNVSLVESTIPGKGIWYRLYVGRYDSQSAAQGAQSQIMKSYRQTAMILEGQ